MSDAKRREKDVRMRGFARRSTVVEAIAWIDAHTDRLAAETLELESAPGRVLAADATSRVDVPGFARSMMDGFALDAVETDGASAYNRLAFSVVGESMPGRPFEGTVRQGQAVRIMTGAPLPDGADAVLPAEFVEIEENRILAQGTVSPGQHVGRVGEDIRRGTTVLTAGRVLRPQDVGVLASIGEGQVRVVRRPRVRIVVAGNELLPAGAIPRGHRIVDSNGPMLSALVRRDAGEPVYPGITPDTPRAILEAMRETMHGEADVVLVAGGSSVGREDHAPMLLAEHGELAIHGVAIRPGSPTGMGLLGGRLVVLLPGNPVACLCAYDFFAGRAIRALGGRPADWPYRSVTAPLAAKIVSTVGRVDYMRVRVADGRVEPLAVGGASLLTSTTRADGFVIVPEAKEGYPPGENVKVYLYDARALTHDPKTIP